MKQLKFIALMLTALTISTATFANTNKDKKTAESVYAFAEKMEKFDATAFKAELKGLSTSEQVKLVKMCVKKVHEQNAQQASTAEYIIAIFIPPLAVGLHTDWDLVPVVSNILWTLLFFLPGVIHAFIVLGR